MNDGNTSSRIRSCIVQKFPAAKKRLLNEDVPLLESGIIDSLGTLEVVGFLEQTFNIKIEDEDLSPENFATLRCLVSFVEGKRGPVGVPAR